MNIRAHAALALAPVIRSEQSLQNTFDKAVDKIEIKDRGLFHELVYGCLRHFEWLDEAYALLVPKKLKNKDMDIVALIFLGIYQLEFLRIPDHAAISETVNATKKLKKHWAKALVNATLRNFTRHRSELVDKLEANTRSRYCLPEWILAQIKSDWPEEWHCIAQHTQQKPPVTLRNNQQRQTPEALHASLIDVNIDASRTRWASQGLTLANNGDVNKVTALENGHASVQDEAAQLAAELLELKEGQKVLDACAAPGGKTCHILESANNLSVTALELDKDRGQQIASNLQRLNIHAEIRICDALETDTWWDNELFDRILLDAPCSATGVIRRHPDIKLLRRESDLAKLADIQENLLTALWPCLAPGGLLLYATCSILKNENERVVSAFLNTQPDAIHSVIDATWGIERPYGRQLFPQTGGHDGFYYAKLIKAPA